jgi:hypothetical protein
MALEETIQAIFLKMLLTYPQPNGGERGAFRVWVEVLSDVDERALQIAAAEYMKAGNVWRPAPGNCASVLELTGDAQSDARLPGTGCAIGVTPWRGTEKEYEEKWGRNDAAIDALRALGGSEWFGNRDPSYDWQARDRFIREYTRIAQQKRLQLGAGAPEQLPGITAAAVSVKPSADSSPARESPPLLTGDGSHPGLRATPAAVAIFSRLQHRYPSKEEAELIVAAVGKYFRDLMWWYEILCTHRANGAGKSVTELVDLFRERQSAESSKDAAKAA